MAESLDEQRQAEDRRRNDAAYDRAHSRVEPKRNRTVAQALLEVVEAHACHRRSDEPRDVHDS
ncbi:MAG TPA: hypothetical protein VF624_06580 [Tepidisphaeraceae bacterium]|jgi:hypothetical protein